MEKSDRELLIEVKTDIKWLKESFDKHVAHHWQIKMIALTAVIGGVISILISIF